MLGNNGFVYCLLYLCVAWFIEKVRK